MGSLRPATSRSRRGRFRLALGLGALALTLLVGAPAAYAAVINVNTTDDELNADGDCSLREAIQAANSDAAVDACAAGSGADLINVPAGTYTLAIPGAGEDANAAGDLDLSGGAALVGAGASTTVIDGAGLDRVVHVLGNPILVAVQDLTIRGGGGECHGGGISVENHAALIVRDSTITDNAAGNGGAISNAGFAEIYDSVLSDNVGGHRGGAIWNGGRMTIESSTLRGNSFTFAGGCPGSAFFGGGGIFNEGPGLIVEESTLEGNTSSFNAGAINNWFGADLSLARSTLSGNSADDRGGGLFNLGTARLENITVSGNSGVQSGGGVWTGSGTLSLASSTLSGNGSLHGVGALQNTGVGTADVGGTILANSSGGDCSGPINSLGYNLIEDAAGCAIAGDPSGNIVGVDPVLGPLADNGGASRTHALLDGSPAIDAGSPACPPPAADQRLVLRPQGSRCDIGAFELETAARIPQHFLRYQLGQPEFAGETVTLVDQFGTLTVRLEEAEWLMNPAEKRRQGRDPEPIHRADEHLVCYGLPYLSTADRTVTVENQLGRSTLRVGRPLTLCTPASKSLVGDPGPPTDDLDHVLCYDVRGETPLFPSETLVARDQFGERTVRIDRTRELCNPAEKRRAGREPEPIQRPEEHLVCYRITTQTPAFAPLSVIANDQFNSLRTLRVRTLERLCVPSTKEAPGTGA